MGLGSDWILPMNSLRQRILISFIALTSVVVLLFGMASFMFAYTAEDQFFYDLMQGERDYVVATNNAPRLPFITVIRSESELPTIVRDLYLEEPNRREFAGENGRHYHLMKMPEQGFLLAEVSEQLVVRKYKTGMFKFLAVLSVIVLAIAATIALLLSRRLTKPLDTLSQLLRETPLDQLPRGFSDSFRMDEIGQFAKTLDNTMQRLADFIQREQDFTRDVSHEIRTPITVSRGALSLLQQTSLTHDQQALIRRLNNSQIQIENTLQILLALAREQEASSFQSTRLLATVEDIILQHSALLEGKDIELTLQISPTAQVPVSKTILTILLSNLISNGFQYTQAGTIILSYENHCFVIRDSGAGISADIKSQVLQSGVKGETSVGLGLGLSIVRRLCEKLELPLTIDSDNQGTTIRIIFPTIPE